jgi:hypothetical protein
MRKPNLFLKLCGLTLQWLLGLMGIYEFLPSSELLSLVGQLLCNDQAITVDICGNVLFIIAGFDSQELNKVSVKYQCGLRTIKSSVTTGRQGDDPCRVGMFGAVRSVLSTGENRRLLLVVEQ